MVVRICCHYGSDLIQPFRSPASARVMSAAGSSPHPLAFWPHQRGEKPSSPRLSAFARKGAIADAAKGNGGAALLMGPSSRMMRFTIPRAGPPEKRFVKAVWPAAELFDVEFFKAARWTALVVDSGQSR